MNNHYFVQNHTKVIIETFSGIRMEKKSPSLNIWPQLNELTVEWEKEPTKIPFFFSNGHGKKWRLLEKVQGYLSKKKVYSWTHVITPLSASAYTCIHQSVVPQFPIQWNHDGKKSRSKKIWLIYYIWVQSSDLLNSFFCSPSPNRTDIYIYWRVYVWKTSRHSFLSLVCVGELVLVLMPYSIICHMTISTESIRAACALQIHRKRKRVWNIR